MANLKVEKRLNSLPTTLAANTMYLIKSGDTVSMYVTDNTGTEAHKVGSEEPIEPFLLMGINDG